MRRVVPNGAEVKVGDVFGRLTVRELVTGSEAGRAYQGAQARCRCKCGARCTVAVKHLRSGARTTCGQRLCADQARSEQRAAAHAAAGGL